ncbi:MAG: VWA domain-containing protein [Leucobacter sp.]
MSKAAKEHAVSRIHAASRAGGVDGSEGSDGLEGAGAANRADAEAAANQARAGTANRAHAGNPAEREERADQEEFEQRARLRAAGALLGVPLHLTDDDRWELTADGLLVGLGWYAARGHSRDEAVALALLQLWEGPRDARVAPARARRRRSLTEARPETVPLILALARVQAAVELLTAFPGLSASLAAAGLRGLPASLAEQPRHLQWTLVLLRAGLGADGAAEVGSDAAVAAEWRGLAGAGGARVLPRVLVPDPNRTPLERFSRSLALLLPPYERLLALDVSERGLGDAAGTGSELPEGEEGGAGAAVGAGTGHGSGDAERAAEGDAQSGGTAAPGADEQDPPGADRLSEAFDPVAAQQAEFVSAFLSTPLPAEEALLEAMAIPNLEARNPSGPRPRELSGAGAGGSLGIAAADYRVRAGQLAGEIERMREVWARIIAERVALVPTIGRRAAVEGEMLDPESLARAVIDTRSGVRRPAVFLRRDLLPRRRRRAGSTDYALLIDRSASMQGRIADAAADAALIMLEALAGVDRDIEHAERRVGVDLDLDIRTALVLFDADAQVVKPLSHGLDDDTRHRLYSGIRSTRGSTNDGAALRTAAHQLGLGGEPHGGGGASGASERSIDAGGRGDGHERRRLVIVVSDGGSNDPAAADAELRRLRASGVGVHGIGLGSDEIVRRYAPSSRRIDEPGEIAAALQALVESQLS